MYKLRRVDIERSEEVFENIEKYKEAVVERLKPWKVILYGSFARGDINEGSDVDLIIVCDWKEGFVDRIGVLLEMNEFGIPIEPIGYTPQEFNALVEQQSPFLLQVLNEGRVIFERKE